MSELSKAEIARINGAKSHGPVTPDGKTRSSMNALKHGLTAQTVCLCNESKQGFQEMFQAQFALWQPQNEVEADLVETLVVCKWRQRRYWGVETATVDIEIDTQAPAFARKYEQADEMTSTAEAIHGLHAKDHSMQLLNRYDTSLDRQYHRALNQLKSIRAQNLFPPPTALRNEPTPAPKPKISNNPPPAQTVVESSSTSTEPRNTTFEPRNTITLSTENPANGAAPPAEDTK